MSQDNDKKVIVLGTPLQCGAETIRELHIHRPTAKNLRKLNPAQGDGPMGMILGLVGEQNGLPPSVMDEMDGADVLEVVSEFGPFLEKRTGAMPLA